MKSLKDYHFNTSNKTYIIAEVGINHGGSLKKAIDLVKSAALTGCDAIKFQTYESEKRAPKKKFPALYEIIKSCELPLSDFTTIKDYCDEQKIEFFSTAFDENSIDFLDSIGMKIYKISSFDLINFKLLEKISSLGKTNILSVGMGSVQEIEEATKILKNNPLCKNSILHCVSAYPTNYRDSNLISINFLEKKYGDFLVGLSDHTNDIKVPCYAVALGARIIEKHYMIDNDMVCIDKSVSITEKQMKKLVKEIRYVETILGNEKRSFLESEKDIIKYRRKNVL